STLNCSAVRKGDVTRSSLALISASRAAGSSDASISALYATSSPPAMGSEPQSPLGHAKRYWKPSALDIALPAIPYARRTITLAQGTVALYTAFIACTP